MLKNFVNLNSSEFVDLYFCCYMLCAICIVDKFLHIFFNKICLSVNDATLCPFTPLPCPLSLHRRERGQGEIISTMKSEPRTDALSCSVIITCR